MLSIQAALAAILLSSAAQDAPAEAVMTPIQATMPTTPASDPGIAPLVLRRDTPVHFMVVSEVTTKTHLAGHRFKLRVDKPVAIDGVIVIPVGATAWGEVLEAKKSGNVGKGGSLEARLLYIESGDIRVPVSGTNTAKGNSAGGETALGVLALGPLGLFAKGNNAKIKAGELMTGFVEEDTALPRPVQAGL